MNEAEWLTSKDPNQMLRLYISDEMPWPGGDTLAPIVSKRKLRLFSCACCRVFNKVKPAQVNELEEKGALNGLTDVQWAQVWCFNPTDSIIIANLLRDILGNPYRPAVLAHDDWKDQKNKWIADWRLEDKTVLWLSCVTPTVKSVAVRIYDERDFAAMPILGDALEDAGCDNQEILDHCRNTGRHFSLNPKHARGCWILDLLLGKEQK